MLEVTPQALSNYKKRGRMPTHLVIKFAFKYGLSVDWLLTGRGEVYREGMGGEGVAGMAAEEGEGYGRDIARSMDFIQMTPEEIIYIGKLLKILRSDNGSTATALKCSIDAFLKALDTSSKPSKQQDEEAREESAVYVTGS